MPNFFRLIFSGLTLTGSILLFIFGHWGWGILGISFTILIAVTYFFHEYMLLAQWYLRKENLDKAQLWLAKITNYEKQLNSNQHGYYNLLIGLIESRKAPLKAEKYFRKALSLGMVMEDNVALAKLSLAGIAMAKRNKKEAETLLKEAQKADKNKLFAEQIKMMKGQMTQIDKVQHVNRGFR